MIAIWYAVVSFMLIVYIVLDGRNFGAGMLHWFVAQTPEERRQVIAAIGPLWSWHEVWLVGFGGTLVAIFPRLMASAFAGYYLALFLILWCLILRGVSIEVGGHINDRLWQTYWDFDFVLSHVLLAVVLIESRIVRPDLPGRALFNPFWWIGLVVVAASAFTLLTGLTSGRELRAFVGSNFLIVGLLATGAAAIFPVMLHSTLAPENSLTAYGVASSPSTLLCASFWWPIAFALAVFYFIFISRRYAGKVSVQRDTQGFY